MTPILYGKSETAFTSNGKGRLVDCISCTVTEERNGIYECEFEYPITGKFYEEMTVNGGVISVTHDDNGDRQAFDIYKYSAPINGIVTFYACHISYRLNGITVNPFTASSCSAALTAIGTNSMQTNPFTFWTDKSVSSTYTLANPASARGLLWGSEGSILDVYGKGEYEFDMFTVKLHTNRGSNSGVTVRYSKNLSSITKTYDESGVYNAVAPYWKGTDGTVVMLSEGYVYNSLPVIRCVPLDLSSEFSESPTQAELRTRANAYLTANEPWTVDENITFDFVPLWQTDEYKSVAVLQKVKLCDTISVYYPKLGVTKVNAKIIKVVYDVLREKYASMEVGTAKQTLESTMLAPVEADISNINSDLSGKIISYINQTPEQITIQASKLSLLGYTTINNGFKVNLDGTFEANGATLEGYFYNHSTFYGHDTETSIIGGGIFSDIDINGVSKRAIELALLSNGDPDGFEGNFIAYGLNNGVKSKGTYGPEGLQLSKNNSPFFTANAGSTNIKTDVDITGDTSVTGTINSIGIEQFNITAGSSKTVTLANSTANCFIVSGSTVNLRTMIIAYTTAAGVTSYTMNPSASSITVTTGTNSITISSNGYARVMHFTF